VVGTGFFRVPKILEACKDKCVSKRPELFTKASFHDYNLVINGGFLEIPEYVDDWVRGLLTPKGPR
jgi:hypothetical protein